MGYPFRFCPDCGGALEPPQPETTWQKCPACGAVHYQNAKPCVGALVVRDGKVMLVRRSIEPYKGYWDIPGGFLDPDEHPEAGVIREVYEETGLHVRPTAIHGIFIDTYDKQASVYTLNIYYLAEIVDGRAEPGQEVVEVGWFGPDALPEQIAFEHARDVLMQWASDVEAVNRTRLTDFKSARRGILS